MAESFEYVFPAIRGLQAGHAYYVSMCPLHLIPKIFLFDEEELPPEVRAQRSLNKGRLPELSRYIVGNRDEYVFSAITASIDSETRFEALGSDAAGKDVGKLHVPMSAKFIINDGQHRKAAIEMALEEAPEIGDETIAVVFFMDPGLKRSQQMFTDLNRHAVRPPRSLSLLYEHRDPRALLAKDIVKRAKVFSGVVEFEKSTLAPRSGKMFTLSAIETASTILLSDKHDLDLAAMAQLGATYWDLVGKQIPEWNLVKTKKLSAGEFRRDYISAHGLALAALAHAGRAVFAAHPEDWTTVVSKLSGLDWSRSNTRLWEGRAMTGGKIQKAHTKVKLTAAVVKRRLGVQPSPEEVELERALEAAEQEKEQNGEGEGRRVRAS